MILSKAYVFCSTVRAKGLDVYSWDVMLGYGKVKIFIYTKTFKNNN